MDYSPPHRALLFRPLSTLRLPCRLPDWRQPVSPDASLIIPRKKNVLDQIRTSEAYAMRCDGLGMQFGFELALSHPPLAKK